MKAIRKYFNFFVSFDEAIELLPEEEQGKMYRAIIKYGLYGTPPEFGDNASKLAWKLIQPILDRKPRGAQEENTNAKKERIQNECETNPKRIQNESDSNPKPFVDKDKEKDKEKGKRPFSLTEEDRRRLL